MPSSTLPCSNTELPKMLSTHFLETPVLDDPMLAASSMPSHRPSVSPAVSTPPIVSNSTVSRASIASAPRTIDEFLESFSDTQEASLSDRDLKGQVQKHLDRFQLGISLTPASIHQSLRQFYIHIAQHSRTEAPALLKRMGRLEHRKYLMAYILGFELVKMLFQMSWQEHERLYHLQHNPEEFRNLYICPVQVAHKLNDLIVPRDRNHFFARRCYFVQRPKFRPNQLEMLAMATFTAESVLELGFKVMRHIESFQFDPTAIFAAPDVFKLGLIDEM
jgi:hypothetical protein